MPGATPEERRAFLLAAAAPTQAQLNKRLTKAIDCRSTERVRELLGLDAQDRPLPEGELLVTQVEHRTTTALENPLEFPVQIPPARKRASVGAKAMGLPGSPQTGMQPGPDIAHQVNDADIHLS